MSQALTNPIFLDLTELKFEEDDFTIQFNEISQNYGIKFKRMYFLKSGKIQSVRGKHAHLNQDQVFLKFNGEITVTLIDLFGLETILTLNEKPLFVPKNYWIELSFEPNSTLLCLATKAYTELKTISDKTQFLNQK
jgi:hypothetical protein